MSARESDQERGFLSRWSRRKAEVKQGVAVPAEAPAVLPAAPAAEAVRPLPPPAAAAPPVEAPAPPAPTLDDVAALAPGDEISRFVARGVDEGVKRAAIKKLFTDPHFNIMDGLDIYIDDYSKPDPIPYAMLRQLNQSKLMGLFAAEEAAEEAAAARAAADAAAASTPPPPDAMSADYESTDPPAAEEAGAPAPAVAAVPQAPDEDPDLQLQPDDAAGRPGAEPRARPDRV